MDDPQYIVLVALDTPSRSAGIYISGGVMAAPTVGAVMADILPYLGVPSNYGTEDVRAQSVIMPDLSGKSLKEANATLKTLNLTAVVQGEGDVITCQIPAAGQTVPGGSQVLLYFGAAADVSYVKVPDFSGMTYQQASEAAAQLDLYILSSGNPSTQSGVVVIDQTVTAGTEVLCGTTISLLFADLNIRD